MSKILDEQPECLFQYVDTVLARLPPRPVVQINGFHTQTVRKGDKREKKHITDFDIMLNLRPYLLTNRQNLTSKWSKQTVVEPSQKAFRGSFRKTVAKGHKGDLEVGNSYDPDQLLMEGCEEYCKSPARLKIFRVSRTVSGLDEQAIRARIETLIRSTHYRGHIKIFFPLEERAVDIYSTHWIQRWRTTTYIRWIFYLTFLWIFAWPILYFMTKRWAIVNVDWPFSVTQPNGDGTGTKQYTTISEDEWYGKHANLIRRLVLEGHQGDASCFDPEEEPVNPQPRRVSSGNQHVDSAISIIQAGVSGWNSVQRAMGGDPDGWGGDC
ncbi:uncharacterized protein K452DRAFT_222073 [Aplosporella prunicola CBS 121167]|uniref:Uncharacterized protein n=1 Tax=Aplosporella prunicola CBS 121167 TaxID=1176127 RepID=A0A6A6BMU3_9PEZI|nr:uncharacterized protein K452DRAFT_222073 [Aplosporella prunicola CBS 121167]KAF2144988.1 hypothetical protein K452DRAFT_222073 [Aplosporella prunicola CBS 121167]